MNENVRNQIGSTFLSSQQSGDFKPFNALLDQYNVSQNDLMSAFPHINQQGINEFIGRGVQFPLYQSSLIKSLRSASPASSDNSGLTMYENAGDGTSVGRKIQVNNNLFNPVLSSMTPSLTTPATNNQVGQSIFESYQQGYKLPQIKQGLQTQFGVKPEQFDASLNDRLGQAIFESTQNGFNVPLTRQGAIEKLGATDDQFNSALDQRLAKAIEESIEQGFNVDQTRQGATTKFGVTNDDFDRALRLYESTLSRTFPIELTSQTKADTGAGGVIGAGATGGMAGTMGGFGGDLGSASRLTANTTAAPPARAPAPVPAPALAPAPAPAGPAIGDSVVNLTPAQQKLYDLLSTIGGEGPPAVVRDYVSGLNDAQALATLATRQGYSTYPSEQLAFEAGRGENPPDARVSAEYLRNLYQVPLLDSPFADLRTAPTGEPVSPRDLGRQPYFTDVVSAGAPSSRPSALQKQGVSKELEETLRLYKSMGFL